MAFLDRCIYGPPEEEQLSNDLSRLRSRLWALAQARPEAIARAAAGLYGRAPEEDEWADLLDLVALEWLDGQGRTVAESLATEPGLEDLAAWPTAVHTSLWTVDGHGDDCVLLRDLVDDSEVAVRCPTTARAELTRRTVLRARLVPWRGGVEFFGEPDLYGEQGVIARLGLLQAWRESPEPAVLAGLRERRRAYATQRDQRRVFILHFGSDLVVFENAPAMEASLAAFMDTLLFQDRGPDGVDRTRAERWRGAHGTEPSRVELKLGATLAEGRPAICFDDVDGFLLLPAFGELRDHLNGRAEFPEVLRLWMDTPELPMRGLAIAGPTRRIAEALAVADAPLPSLLPHRFSIDTIGTPSTLPEFEDRS